MKPLNLFIFIAILLMCAQSIALERLDKPQSDRVDSEKERQLPELKNRLSNNWVDLYKTNSEGPMLYRLLAPINFNSKKFIKLFIVNNSISFNATWNEIIELKIIIDKNLNVLFIGLNHNIKPKNIDKKYNTTKGNISNPHKRSKLFENIIPRIKSININVRI